MQYFIGYKDYSSERPFAPSLLVTFHKRLPEEVMNRIIEKSFIKAAEKDDNDKDDKGSGTNSPGSGDSSVTSPKEEQNRGTLIIDATCTPADIAYPTDLELCDKAWRWTETILDQYWKVHGPMNGRTEKLRTYRKIVRRRFLKLNKRRKKNDEDDPERAPLSAGMHPP